MTRGDSDGGGDTAGERLRLRLYRKGADQDDVTAYLAVQEPDPGAEEGPQPQPGAVAVHRRRPVVVAGSAVVVGVAAVLAALGVVLGAARAPASATATPLPTSSVDPGTRAAFIGRIAARQDAGLGAWWDPSAPLVEQHGSGSGRVVLPPPSGSGRITVLLVLGSDAVAGWSVDRLVIHDDRTIHLSEEAGATGGMRAGVPAVGRVEDTALTRPARLLIEAPTGVRWDVAAVYTD